MSFTWYFDPEFKAPYRSDAIKESCELAYDYFCMILDDFVARLPEYRRPCDFADWLADEPTLADRVHLIFPKGFGEWDEQNNHNPRVWPAIIELSNGIDKGTTEEFTNDICDSWENFNEDGQCKSQMQLLQRIFDWLTSYLQLFVVLSDPDVINADFKYPPEDECGNLVRTIFRKP